MERGFIFYFARTLRRIRARPSQTVYFLPYFEMRSSSLNFDVTTEKGRNAFEEYIAPRSYVQGYSFSSADVDMFHTFQDTTMTSTPNATRYPQSYRWYIHIAALLSSRKRPRPISKIATPNLRTVQESFVDEDNAKNNCHVGIEPPHTSNKRVRTTTSRRLVLLEIETCSSRPSLPSCDGRRGDYWQQLLQQLKPRRAALEGPKPQDQKEQWGETCCWMSLTKLQCTVVTQEDPDILVQHVLTRAVHTIQSCCFVSVHEL